MHYQNKIFTLVLLPCLLFTTDRDIAVIQFVSGSVNIKSAVEDVVQVPAIPGRTIQKGDIIHIGENGRSELVTINQDIRIKLDELTELSLQASNQATQIELHYGKVFTESRTKSNKNSFIETPSSRVKLGNSEIWIHCNYSGEDEIFLIEGQVIVQNKKFNTRQNISIGETIFSGKTGLSEKEEIHSAMVPQKIYQRLELNRSIAQEDEPFSELAIFTEDLIPGINPYPEEDKGGFDFSIEVGSFTVENATYTKAALVPAYHGKNFQFGYNFEGFIGSDSARDLNTFSDVFQILDRITELEFTNTKRNFSLKLGQIHNLTYGYGMLLKRYTNTVSYPIWRNTGILIDYQSDVGAYSFNLFVSSLKEISSSGGLIGFYGSGLLSQTMPLRIGLGYVMDSNQFTAVPDSIWGEEIDPFQRNVSGFQLDFTYHLKSGFRNDTYLFGEITTLSFPDNLRYIRPELLNGDDSNPTEQGIQRNGTFGILGPGIWLKIGHHRELKIAFNFTSPLHTTPFFGETYNLERARYVVFNLDSLQNAEPFAEDSLWIEMISEYRFDDENTTQLYLSKDIYPLLNPTKNIYNKFGISTEYRYTFRNLYSYGLELSLFKESGDTDYVTTFYTFGMDLSINEGVIKGISELNLYFNQYYTEDLFELSSYNENMVFGARLGIRLLKNLALRISLHDVFYDLDMDGEIDTNSTQGLEIVARF